MSRFVILLHETPPAAARATHWDFMLETGNVLRTWALSEEPRIGRRIEAVALPDHRLAYLDYEGPVSGNRGTVTRWDAGQYSVEQEAPEHLTLRLHGARLTCRAEFSRDKSAPDVWRVAFTFRGDST